MAATAGYSPDMDLPKQLRDILGLLLGANSVTSWQVYSEKYGTSVRIRFASAGHVDQLPASVSGLSDHNDQQSIKFTKKTPSQVRRDQNRSKPKHSRVTRSTSVVIPSPENIRNSHDFTDIFTIDSPESVSKEEYHDSLVIDTPESVIKDEYHISKAIPSDQIITDTKYNMIAHESSDTQDSDDSRLSDRATTYRGGPRPKHRTCSYCGVPHRDSKIYLCTKDRCERKICDKCIADTRYKRHKRHKKYLTNFDTGHHLDSE